MENTLKNVEELYLTNQYEPALIMGFQIVEENPFNFICWTLIGQIYNRLEHYPMAIEIFKKSLLINDNQLQAHKRIAFAYSKLREPDLAIQHIIRSISLKPEDTLLYCKLGCLNITKQKYDIALQSFNRGLRYDQNNIRIYFEKANCFCLMDKYHLAIRIYQIVIKLDPDSGEAYRSMGNAYGRLGNNQQALQCYGKAISINPNDIQAYYLQGRNLYEQNLLYMANMSFDKVLQLNYKHQEALEYYGMIKLQSHVFTERDYKNQGIFKEMQQYRQAGQIDLVNYFNTLFYTLSHCINGYLHLDISRNDTKYQKVCAMAQNHVNMFKIHKNQEQELIAVFYDELEDYLQMNEKQIKNKLDEWLQTDYLKKYKLIQLNEVLAELCLEKSINKQDFNLIQKINFKSLTEYSRFYSTTKQVAFQDGIDIILQILK